jgi:hypothetical protein
MINARRDHAPARGGHRVLCSGLRQGNGSVGCSVPRMVGRGEIIQGDVHECRLAAFFSIAN